MNEKLSKPPHSSRVSRYVYWNFLFSSRMINCTTVILKYICMYSSYTTAMKKKACKNKREIDSCRKGEWSKKPEVGWFENILYGQKVCKQVARAQRLIMNRHCLDLYLFEDKLGKAVIYTAGAQKYGEQVNKHRDENVGLTEVNKECRNWKVTRNFAGMMNRIMHISYLTTTEKTNLVKPKSKKGAEWNWNV